MKEEKVWSNMVW